MASQELDAVVKAAHAAGEAALSYFQSGELGTRAKGERDVVTSADTASEKILTERLRALFPDDGIVGEEGTAERGSKPRCWYVDPLDGTINFSRFIPVWGVSVGLLDQDTPVLGVVYDPIRQETFTTAPGVPAQCNGSRVRVSPVTDLADALVHVTVDFKDRALTTGLRDLQTIAPRVLRTRNLGSAALALAWIAAGRLDGMVHRSAYPWDYAAGVALIKAAGGEVTDLDGSRYGSATKSIVASNGKLHSGLLEIVQQTEG